MGEDFGKLKTKKLNYNMKVLLLHDNQWYCHDTGF